MFIAHRIQQVAKLREVRNVTDAEHSAPDGAWLNLLSVSYKHLAPPEFDTCLTPNYASLNVVLT